MGFRRCTRMASGHPVWCDRTLQVKSINNRQGGRINEVGGSAGKLVELIPVAVKFESFALSTAASKHLILGRARSNPFRFFLPAVSSIHINEL